MDEELSKLAKIYAQKYQEWEFAWNQPDPTDQESLKQKKFDLLQAQSSIMEYLYIHPEIRSLNLRDYITYTYSASSDLA